MLLDCAMHFLGLIEHQAKKGNLWLLLAMYYLKLCKNQVQNYLSWQDSELQLGMTQEGKVAVMFFLGLVKLNLTSLGICCVEVLEH